MKPRILFISCALLAIVFLLPTTRAASPTPPLPEIKLGAVTVRGQQVIRVLQDIKLALKQPNSTDPKLANVVVCRIHDAIGSHSNQVLTCATNKTLNERRTTVQIAWNWPVPVGGSIINNLNQVLYNLPGQELNMNLNGTTFRSLLEKLPFPAPAQTTVRMVAAAARLVTGQGTAEVLQLGRIKVTGEPMIQKVLQTVKSGLSEPYSSDARFANTVVCRLNTERGNSEDQVLTCATNRVWTAARGSLQTIMAGATNPAERAGCSSGECPAAVLSPFNSALDALPGRYLQISVNGAQLHKLLNGVPVTGTTGNAAGATRDALRMSAA